MRDRIDLLNCSYQFSLNSEAKDSSFVLQDSLSLYWLRALQFSAQNFSALSLKLLLPFDARQKAVLEMGRLTGKQNQRDVFFPGQQAKQLPGER
jgi:hypothetical protein